MNNEFEFHFSLDDENENDEYKFVNHKFDVISNSPAQEQVKQDIDEGEDEAFQDTTEELEEEYGVHDVGFNPDTQLFGYTTYEVEEERIPELIEKWMEHFRSRGFTVTNHRIEEGYE